MKQNNMKDKNKDIDFLEVDRLYGLLMIKYPNEFDKKRAYDLANVLYLNGIRAYMFFESKFDVDEIVYYIAYRDKVKKICRKREYYYSDEDVNNGNTKSGQIINFNDYLKKFRSRK